MANFQVDPSNSQSVYPTRADYPLDLRPKPDVSSQDGRKSAKSAATKKSNEKGNGSFRFIVVDDPVQFRDREEMRENRAHVMHNYLDKKGRRTSNSLDMHGNGSAKPSKKRKSPSVPLVVVENLEAPSHDDYSQSGSSRLTPAESIRSEAQSDKENAVNDVLKPGHRSRTTPEKEGQPRTAIRRLYSPRNTGRSLVTGIGGRFDHSPYMRTMLEEIPAGPGSSLEPFGTWPTFLDQSLDVNALKWSCSQRFGSDSLSAHWIPTLLRARHAFLSTLCISSAHDAIMTRALVPSHAQSYYKNMTRWKVKNDVISMVGSCMTDPDMQAADETIVSVVHLLNSDIMGCDDREMQIHQDGLLKMVHQRGGLSQLGLSGQLASVLTITNYLIAALREMSPHDDYVQFASKTGIGIPDNSQPLPESPIYSRMSGFHTVKEALPPESETYELLDTVRALTNRFYFENVTGSAYLRGPSHPAKFGGRTDENVDSLFQKVLTFAPARDKEFNDMNERYTYESIRLAACIYAYALSKKLPFSKAAVRILQDDSLRNLSIGSDRFERDKSIPNQLKYALLRTDVSFCWDHLGGVLFWITLVGGAAANPGPLANEERWGDAEDARKFLAALAVRCCIVLSFQYGHAILETLKRIVTIEAALLPKTSNSRETVKQSQTVSTPQQDAGQVLGPTEPSHLQKGFADFAQEFWSI